ANSRNVCAPSPNMRRSIPWWCRRTSVPGSSGDSGPRPEFPPIDAARLAGVIVPRAHHQKIGNFYETLAPRSLRHCHIADDGTGTSLFDGAGGSVHLAGGGFVAAGDGVGAQPQRKDHSEARGGSPLLPQL